jgi:endonuclease YncB( thermonuclease family)
MARRRLRIFVCCVLAALICAPRAIACDLPEGETATVASVEDGETVTLTDGRKVRLAGVKAPAAPLGWKGDDPWPFVAEATDALTQLASGGEVELRFDERRGDRHGHVLAQVYVTKDTARVWVQEALLRQGLARVYSFPDMRACVNELLTAERNARAARRGLWRSWAYRIEDAGDAERLGKLTRTYQLVEGEVVAVGEGRKWLYLNFMEDWRRDFTVTIARKDLAAFEAAGLDLMGLAGQRLRVRGWVEWWNGPMIEATHPEQIELLGAASPG